MAPKTKKPEISLATALLLFVLFLLPPFLYNNFYIIHTFKYSPDGKGIELRDMYINIISLDSEFFSRECFRINYFQHICPAGAVELLLRDNSRAVSLKNE